jgi:hypothetical protein
VAYWISARLGREWRNSGEIGEVPRLLRRLQTIRIGRLQAGKKPTQTLMTKVPKELNETIEKLGLIKVCATVPAWVL